VRARNLLIVVVSLAVALLGALSAATSPARVAAAGPVLVDDFSTAQTEIAGYPALGYYSPGTGTVVASGSGILGGERDTKVVYDPTSIPTNRTNTIVARVSNGTFYSFRCTPTEQFSEKAGISTSLCQQLVNAGIPDYVNHVQAQSGKALTADEAALLIRLAGYLP